MPELTAAGLILTGAAQGTGLKRLFFKNNEQCKNIWQLKTTENSVAQNDGLIRISNMSNYRVA